MQPKNNISKPIVIMSKPAHALPHAATSETSSSPQVEISKMLHKRQLKRIEHGSLQRFKLLFFVCKGNVIVLDLSQDGKMASQPNNTLAEIFNSTGRVIGEKM
jgi:hypothetical protein